MRKKCADCGGFFDVKFPACPFCHNQKQAELSDFKKRWAF